MIEWLKNTPAQPIARLLLAHGAGAPMDSEFMQAVAERLAEQRVDVWRFEFPYMAERRVTGKKRPPSPAPQLLAFFQQAVAEAANTQPELPLFIGGKSMGGRMATMLVEAGSDSGSVAGVICLGYPFHPPGKPEKTRVAHLQALPLPCLIVQGTRDALGSAEEVKTYPLAETVQCVWLQDGDHDFKPRVKSGHRQSDHWQRACAATAQFIQQNASRAAKRSINGESPK